MITEKETIRISKFLSLVLRHQPEEIGISLDENGWTDVKTLIEKCNGSGVHFDFEILKFVVDTNSKKRFSFNESYSRIRASQGHSVDVDLNLAPKIPPEILYHGTGEKSTDAILSHGLQKMNRHHVHLSADKETALKVGQRHGKPVIFEVAASAMHNEGIIFYQSDNGVWLTDSIDVRFLKVLE
ncbi:MAG TPA: RNA 2'-phosphotransferase [Chitinophagales bacterium]|nr:RNA 2'-phosphotransferase [Chitinophagales bacterium]